MVKTLKNSESLVFNPDPETKNKMQRDAAINEICTAVMKKHRAAMERYRDGLRSSKDEIILKDYLKYVFKPEFLK